MTQSPPNRCRIVLIAPWGESTDAFEVRFSAAISGGDVASLIIPQYAMDETAYQALAEALVPIAQARGVAAVIAGDSRVAGRVKADGVHIESGIDDLAEAIRRHAGKLMVGAGGAKTRDDAMELGEMQPDYVFFGRFGFDNKPDAHPRNLSLGEWWAEVIEIPCIVMAGFDIASVEQVAATGADFVALSSAVFGEGVDPREAVARANAILDETAPRFEE